MNTSKTKMMPDIPGEGFLIKGKEIKVVKEYNCLSQLVAFEDMGR